MVLVLLLAEAGVRILARRLPEPQEWSTPEAQAKVHQMRTIAEHGGADVVLLGSSVIDVSVDPSRLTGRSNLVTAYNAGLGAGTIEMVRIWTRDFVMSRLKPAVAVIGVCSRDLNANDPEQADVEQAFLSSQPIEADLGTEGLVDRIERVAEHWSYLVRYRTVLRDPRNLVRGRADPADEPLTGPRGQYRGFRDGHYVRSERSKEFFLDVPLHDFAVGSAKVAELRRLIADLRSSGVRVIVLDVPVTLDYVHFAPEGYASYERVIGDVAREGRATLIRGGIWPDRYFADALHVNARGATRVTSLVSDALGRLPTP